MTNETTKDGTCPHCGVILNMYWHYGFDGHPWCWCQNCKKFVKLFLKFDTGDTI